MHVLFCDKITRLFHFRQDGVDINIQPKQHIRTDMLKAFYSISISVLEYLPPFWSEIRHKYSSVFSPHRHSTQKINI